MIDKIKIVDEVIDDIFFKYTLNISDERCYSVEFKVDNKHIDVKVSGFVKWDGCSEFNFDALHLCGKDSVNRLAETIKSIHKRCGEFMDGDEEDFDRNL